MVIGKTIEQRGGGDMSGKKKNKTNERADGRVYDGEYVADHKDGIGAYSL